MAYRLRGDVLRKAAAAHGDPSVRRIIMRTGLPRSVVQRNLAGHSEPSLGSLMRYRDTYNVPLDELVEEVPDDPAAADPVACVN